MNSGRPKTVGFPGILPALLAAGLLASCSGNPPAPKEPPVAGPPPAELKALARAAYEGDRERVEKLLDAGVPVDANLGSPGKPVTALLVALAADQDAVARALIRRGASLQSAFEGYSASDFAFFRNKDDIARSRPGAPR